MKKFLSFLVSRWFLAFLLLILLAIGVWFLGPYIAFGGLKPLESTALRVIVIALMFGGVLLWLTGMSTAIVFAALLCLLIWYAAPLLSLGDAKPMASAEARIIAIAIVIVLFAVWGLVWLWRRMRSDEQFLKKALNFGNKNETPASTQIKALEARMKVALSRLKTMRFNARGIGRAFQGTRYLYELPWYIAIGSAESGKTRALLNAGLPLSAESAPPRTGATGSLSGVDWWLTNEAVFIDTAGYYTHPGTSSHTLDLAALAKRGSESLFSSASEKDATLREPAALAVEEKQLRRIADTDEWFGFLSLLRRYRPRAPINGALLTISLETLVSTDPTVREAEANALRERLAELRRTLGVRFPVYLIVTQMDRLSGFTDYFASLTEENRAQIWGFTLPLAASLSASAYSKELDTLASRLADGVNTRLEDEYDVDRRRKLAALPEAFAVLCAPVSDLLTQLFFGSRFDDTQQQAMLRGVYFTSTMQGDERLEAEPLTINQRLKGVVMRPFRTDTHPASGIQSYFLRDIFTKVVLPEAHLVRPNLRWEYRFRLVRLLGHALAVLLFAWLAISLHVSFGNNSDYLDAIARKAQALSSKVAQLYRDPKPEMVPDALTEARYLPTWTGIDLGDPSSDFRYGLFAAPGVVDVSGEMYRSLENNLLVPQIVHRLEAVIDQSIANKDAKSAYDALRVYLMLYDRAKFNASEVKSWVFDDWAKTDSASIFGGRASMLGHVDQLFSGEHVVQSPLIRNDALIERARAFLDMSNGTQRLYDRAKAAMQTEAPDDFTLLRAVGPQAGTVFTRASGEPLSRGVSGLFTFAGYRELFDKRLASFINTAREDDAWVMGRAYLSSWTLAAQKKTAELTASASGADDPLTDAIRRLYLTEYAQRWATFLSDIRPVTGSSLAFNLPILRQFAAPDSPLERLAHAAVRETTLTQRVTTADSSIIDKTTSQIADKAKALGLRSQERVERELVDDRFAALREMVTGSARTSRDAQAAPAQAGKTGLDGVTMLLNETYTALSIADNALANNSLPPANEASGKLKVAANTMPAPFREVLSGLAAQGSHEVNQGIGQLLSRQMQSAVGDACRLAVEGNYPFAPDSSRDIGIDDFTRMFAQGGVIDDFFTKNLAPFVDASSHPWRYKTLPGATEPVQGPDLEPFEHAQAIRNVFFGDQGKQIAWKAELRVPELDPTILSLAIDIDGQSMLYQHGPVTPLKVVWPGPRGGVHVDITANPRIRADTSTIAVDGPWALLRLLRKGQIVQTATPGRTRVVFDFDGRKAALDMASTGSVDNPLTSTVLTNFRCPSAMPVFGLADSGPPPGLPAAATLPGVTAGSPTQSK